MSYEAFSYNYATPPSSVIGLLGETSVVDDKKYFALFDNTLDGSYSPISGDVGLWGSSLSDDHGVLSEPYVVHVRETREIRAFRLTGSKRCFPVNFYIEFYNDNTLLETVFVSDNDSPEYVHSFTTVVNITHYTVVIEVISAPNSVVMLHNMFYPDVLKRFDTVSIKSSESSIRGEGHMIVSYDTATLRSTSKTAIANHAICSDILRVTTGVLSKPTNIHTVMKSPSRKVYGKVYITYTDPMLDSFTVITSDFSAYNSNVEQLLDGLSEPVDNLFTLYENDLSGAYVLSDIDTQVGWTSNVLSDEDGDFEIPPSLKITFEARPITGLPIFFNDTYGCVPRDFTVVITKKDHTIITKDFVDNTAAELLIIPETIPDVVSIEVTIYSATRAGYPVTIIDIPIISTLLYEGYSDLSRLMRIDLLEELTYEDSIEALGGISANEVTVVLDNSHKDFFFNNPMSVVASQLKRNRRIEPWLGAEVVPGEIEWYRLGTFWSYNWDVPVNGLTATVVGFDTIGLLDTTDFHHHTVLVGKSIGQLIEYVLENAKEEFSFITYSVDPSLYDIVIPYAWFDHGSHSAALRKISMCYPMHVYCDRNGVICAAPQRIHRDYYYDTWSDSTNVKDKTYSSLYTTLPNIVNVTVKEPVVTHDVELARDEKSFTVVGEADITLNFNEAYLSDLVLEIDTSVPYSYEVFSWGITVHFVGSGPVYSIVCKGTAVSLVDKTTLTRSNAASIKLNGAVTRDVSADFIQTQELGATLIDRLFSLADFDRYDATVNYRGDIALSINDPILLLDGIAPDNRYNIKRHELSWDGALRGTAELNT